MNAFVLVYDSSMDCVALQVAQLGVSLAKSMPTHIIVACQKMRLIYEHERILQLTANGVMHLIYRNNLIYSLVGQNIPAYFIEFLLEDLGWPVPYELIYYALKAGRFDIADDACTKIGVGLPSPNMLSFAVTCDNSKCVEWVANKIRPVVKSTDMAVAEAVMYGYYDCLVYLCEQKDLCHVSIYVYSVGIMKYFRTGDPNVLRCLDYLMDNENHPEQIQAAAMSNTLASCVCCCFYVQYTATERHNSRCALVSCHPRLRYLFDVIVRYGYNLCRTSEERREFVYKMYLRCFSYGNYCALVILNQEYMPMKHVVRNNADFSECMNIATHPSAILGKAWLANFEFLLGPAGYKSLIPDPANDTTLLATKDYEIFKMMVERSENKREIIESYSVWGRAVVLAQCYDIESWLSYLCSLDGEQIGVQIATRQEHGRALLSWQ